MFKLSAEQKFTRARRRKQVSSVRRRLKSFCSRVLFSPNIQLNLLNSFEHESMFDPRVRVKKANSLQ